MEGEFQQQTLTDSLYQYVMRVCYDIKQSYICMPIVTKTFFNLQITIYIVGIIVGYSISNWCNGIIAYQEDFHIVSLYRLFTAAFFHGGLFHIFFNMLCFQGVGSYVERITGSFLFLILILLFIPVGSMFEVVLSFLMYLLTLGIPTYLNACSIGFSGVLFGLIVLLSHFSLIPSISFFGFTNVPTRIYPWVLLIFTSLIFTGLSFLGHLGGMIAAYCYTNGLFNCIIPSPTFITSMESSPPRGLSWLINYPGYIRCNGRPLEEMGHVVPASVSDVVTDTSNTSFQAFTGKGFKLGTNTDEPV